MDAVPPCAAKTRIRGWRRAGHIRYHTGMRPNGRRLAGTILLLLFVIAYVFAAMLVAVAILPTGGQVVAFLYYAIAGLAWVPLAGLIISWMHKVPAQPQTPAQK